MGRYTLLCSRLTPCSAVLNARTLSTVLSLRTKTDCFCFCLLFCAGEEPKLSSVKGSSRCCIQRSVLVLLREPYVVSATEPWPAACKKHFKHCIISQIQVRLISFSKIHIKIQNPLSIVIYLYGHKCIPCFCPLSSSCWASKKLFQ